jgi:hypothetical protein
MGGISISPHFLLIEKLTEITEILSAISFVNIFIISTFARNYSNSNANREVIFLVRRSCQMLYPCER